MAQNNSSMNNGHGTPRHQANNGKHSSDAPHDALVDDLAKFTGSDEPAVRESIKASVKDSLSLMDIGLSVIEFSTDEDPEEVKRLLDMIELRLKTLTKNQEIYGVSSKHKLTPEEEGIGRPFSAREILLMWDFRRKNLVVTPISRIYLNRADFVTDVCNEFNWSRKKAETYIQNEYANFAQDISSIGVIVYEKDD